jgi:hypothetical protein
MAPSVFFAVQALALSQVSNPFVQGDHSYIAEATRGILFLGSVGTPHSDLQYSFGGFLWAQLSGTFGATYAGLLRTVNGTPKRKIASTTAQGE